jgi:uncharacterized alkaline shock family protein YloU
MTVTTAETGAAAAAGRTELGAITIADGVIAKVAARAAAENPDVGAAAARILGRAVPGAGHLGLRGTDLAGLPKASVDVDGSKAFVNLEISVRWPAQVPAVADHIRSHLRSRVTQLTGLSVEEVHIVVADLVTDITPPPRAR